MAENVCPQCGAPNAPDARECKYCGEAFTAPAAPAQPSYQQQQPQYQQQQPVYQQPVYQQPFSNNNNGIDPSWPIKSKVAAGLLGIFLGGLGIHKFYLGKIGLGILYLVFCWTYIPAIIGFIEGIIYLASNEHNFQVKHRVRVR